MESIVESAEFFLVTNVVLSFFLKEAFDGLAFAGSVDKCESVFNAGSKNCNSTIGTTT